MVIFELNYIYLTVISLSLSYQYSTLATSRVIPCRRVLLPDPTSFSLPALQMLFTEYLAYPIFWLIAPSLVQEFESFQILEGNFTHHLHDD